MAEPDGAPESGIEAIAAAEPQKVPDMRRPRGKPKAEAFDTIDLPDDCPVTALGHLKQRYFFLDFAGQLIELGSEFRKGEIFGLFGTATPWAEKYRPWIQWKSDPSVKKGEPPKFIEDGFSQREVQRAMILACSKKGIFDPTDRVRGRGSHRGPDGELILHCGDELLVAGRRGTRNNVLKSEWMPTGLLGKLIFPTGPQLPHPAEHPASGRVADQVLDQLDGWKWAVGRSDTLNCSIAAHIVLCWMALAMVCGATRHRPNLWFVGPSGAGKTALQQFIRAILSEWALDCEDPSEAWLAQTLADQRLAVTFDEPEPDGQNGDFHKKIIKLARLSFSGGKRGRGSTDGKSPMQFTAYSTFLFSSINHHELEAQDRNRMCVLHLSKFPPALPGQAPYKPILPGTLKEWGDQLRRRMAEQWHRYDETLLAFQTEMLAQGFNPREQDTYGNFLACGDLLLHDEAPKRREGHDDRVTDLVREVRDRLLNTARIETVDLAERCIGMLTSHRLPGKAGQLPQNVGRWIATALRDVLAGNVNGDAGRHIQTFGLKLVHLKKGFEGKQGGVVNAHRIDDPIFLAVATKSHKGVKEIFTGNNPFSDGQWSQTLAGIPGAYGNKKTRFDGPDNGCTVVPIGEIVPVDEVKEEAALWRAEREAEERGRDQGMAEER